MRATTPRAAASVRSLAWIGGVMVTERYAAYALEEGDEIVADGDVFKIVLISDTVTGYRFMVVNENQEMKNIDCTDETTFRVVVA
jgi:hypothetical protein